MPIVYTCFSTDVIHEGHLNIIREAQKYGDVYVGVLSDSATVKYNKFPTVSFEKRLELVRGIEGVKKVVIQNDVMYDRIVESLHPDYIIHGDNWTQGTLKALRDNAEKLLSAYGGKVIDVPYTYSEAVRRIDNKIKEKLSMPEYRRKRLRQLIGIRRIVKAMEVHSGLTGLIVEKTFVERQGELDQFDAMWLSSLCDSTAKGKPDIELVDMTSRFKTIDDIMDVTTKPIIFDGDTGGLTEHFVYMVHTL
ncbi:MAG: isocitrate lyase/phosphoenolpyruvate mutase family protein [Candidatus Methanomethylophilaceae archaeon]|nr:isocitrate lyase/phosphoenolpyruvate mutase family protein [Candidatus Methanomethylophilaceae archaeon]